MAFVYYRLAEITTLPLSVGVLFTQPAGKTTYTRAIIIHNANTIAETIKLYKVPDSGGSVGTPGATNKFYEEVLDPNATRIIEFAAPGLIFADQNETLQGETTTASKVTIEITGGQE